VTIDLGYVMNAGFTLLEAEYNTSGYDDVFALSVLVQMSDNAANLNGAQFPIYLAVSFGELIIVGTSSASAPATCPLLVLPCSQPPRTCR
jgi:hypothetical protein